MFLPLRTRLLLTLLLGLAVVWLRTASTRRPAPTPKPRATAAAPAPKPKPRPPRVEDVLEAASAQAQSKAAKAARTVWETTPPNVQTLLLTDEAGVAVARTWSRERFGPLAAARRHARGDDEAAPAWAVLRAAPFDAVVSVGNASEGLAFADMPQFQAFRAFEVTSVDGVKKDVLRKDRPEWTNREDATNRALRALRLAKIRSLVRGARLFAYTLFLDVDTIVCRDLRAALCAVGGDGAHVAFVPVTNNRTHGDAVVRAALGVANGELLPAEANTGVLALADSPTTRWLLKAWEAAYVKLSELGQLMDQPAFRAALHLTRDRLRFVHLDAAYNCRGRDTARKNSVRISCDGYHDYENYLQKSLEGGKGCVVLHSHDASSLRATWPNALPNYYVESSVPYGTLREATGPGDSIARTALARRAAAAGNASAARRWPWATATSAAAQKTRAHHALVLPDMSLESTARLMVTRFYRLLVGDDAPGVACGRRTCTFRGNATALDGDDRRGRADVKAALGLRAGGAAADRTRTPPGGAPPVPAPLLGPLAFGACGLRGGGFGIHARPCAYFVFIRNPVDRMISEWYSCRGGYFDEKKRPKQRYELDASREECVSPLGADAMRGMSLAAWAEAKGNVQLQQLVPLSALDFDYDADPAGGAPSPIAARLAREGAPNEADARVFIDRSRDWFAVVATSGKVGDSMRLLLHAITGVAAPVAWIEDTFLLRPPSTKGGSAAPKCPKGFRKVNRFNDRPVEACAPESLVPRPRPKQDDDTMETVRAAVGLDMLLFMYAQVLFKVQVAVVDAVAEQQAKERA
ncbi:hypothetical protein JL720_1158 [Aureococcus anophagefferens]|nr:hypothetical protein JL720_1158 [Aureococcus anophagefferens]